MEFRRQPNYNMGLEDILKAIFWKKVETRSVARKILQKIKKEGIPRDAYERVQKDLDISQSQYYSIMNRLHALGLISVQKDEDGFKVWKLSEIFPKQLERLATIYRTWKD
ncbi:hypothetical protein AKJ56_00325 [candidate division MSBL1 archaeon SCGC-AAA382N08]|uniref:Transcription regulator TrmB N-terminal domain-containing protein n=1 Tax=candidate division MSBL1 archaeon SCGC-AAA382N08 TaxID=1698285 RepID=A0A133VQN3_9EURY|nr:hypothetical protein AKJ56_00325 [candidate division MSBL1 archaeon SCGC-AAA382N08]